MDCVLSGYYKYNNTVIIITIIIITVTAYSSVLQVLVEC